MLKMPSFWMTDSPKYARTIRILKSARNILQQTTLLYSLQIATTLLHDRDIITEIMGLISRYLAFPRPKVSTQLCAYIQAIN